MNIFGLIKLILNRAENERRYMESVSQERPTFKKSKRKTSLKNDILGDPVGDTKGSVKEKVFRAAIRPIGINYSKDIEHAHPYIQKRWHRLKRMYQEKTGHDLFLTCTWRSPKYQARLYAKGRTKPGPKVTNINGTTRLSQHNYYPARAIDVCVDLDPGVAKVVNWDVPKYKPLIAICKKLGLVNGGSWKKFPDYPHIQCPRDVV